MTEPRRPRSRSLRHAERAVLRALAMTDAGRAARFECPFTQPPSRMALCRPASAPASWVHTDIHEGNLLVRDGRASAVIDWGGLGAGDPAVELNAAWGFLPPDAAAVFRDAMGLDDAAWLRGRGWALVPSISGLVYCEQTSPHQARLARRTVHRVLADARAGSG